jgi:hypothetical protein
MNNPLPDLNFPKSKFKKNWFSRIRLLLTYNFQLIRSEKKYFKFLLICMLPYLWDKENSQQDPDINCK